MWLIFTLGTLALVQSQEWTCGGDVSHVPNIPRESRRLLPRSSTLAPMRVKFFYNDVNLGDPALTTQLKDVVMPAVGSFLKNSLKVYPIEGNLVLYQGECILSLIIPTDHTTVGVDNVDLVIYVGVENNSTANYVARAGLCRTDTTGLGNPTAGGTTINIFHFNPLSVTGAIATMTHEITHVLGFSGYGFTLWRNKAGIVYPAGTLTKTEVIRGVSKTIMVSETVLAKAREAFGCPTIKGIEIEDYGGAGTAGSHWDKRIMMNDFMIGHVPSEPIWSTITLAALQDSGWYTADYTLASPPTFGVAQGCELFDSKCVVNGVSSNQELWCDTADDYTCDAFALNKGPCKVYTYTGELPVGYQYFTDKKVGGDGYADYCPYRSSYTNGDCRNKPFIWYDDADEVAGQKSRCFESTLSKSYIISDYAACYEVIQCTDTGAVVKIGTQTITCPFTGGAVEVPGYYGKINCPKSKILCDNVSCTSMCHARGRCVKGECKCLDGFGGFDCSVVCSSGCKSCDSEKCLTCVNSAVEPVNGVCTSCPSNCLTCPASQNTCETCVSGYTVSNGVCVKLCSDNCASCSANDCLTCNPGFFLNTLKSCEACSTNCKLCTSTGCTECSANYKKVNGKCEIDCGINCTTCKDASTCEICATNYKVVNGKCETSCISNCASCKDATTCDVCATNYKKVNGKCEIDCGINCTTCKDVSTCEICATNYKVVNGKCESSCISNCASCKDATTCDVCATSYKKVNGKCEPDCGATCSVCKDTTTCSTCANGNYNEAGKCLKCTAPCMKCTSSSLCLECPTTHNLVSGSCQLKCSTGCTSCTSITSCSSCATGHSLISGSCTKCPSNCEVCSSTTKCTLCNSGYKVENGACTIQCSSNCLSCKSSTECTSCNSGYFISSNACSQCSTTCKTCSGQKSTCTGCNTGYKLSSGTCVVSCSLNCKTCSKADTCDTCNDGYYVSNSKCTKCTATGCKTCSTSTKCLSCNTGYIKSGDSCKAQCSSNCSSCKTPNTCDTCNSGYRKSGSNCLACTNKNCNTCNLTACLTCKTGFKLSSGKCI